MTISSNTVENLATDHTRSLPHTAIVSSRESFLEGLWAQWFENLLSIRSLQDDWDGDGADAPTPEVVDAASRFLNAIRRSKQFPVPNRIVPSPNGTVVIEWQLPNIYIEAEITAADTIEWMVQEGGHEPKHYTEEKHYTEDLGRQYSTETSSIPVYRAA